MIKRISDFGFRISVEWRPFRKRSEHPGNPKSEIRNPLFSRRMAIALAVCLLLPAGCRNRDRKIRVQQTDEDTATLASVIHMGDPKAAPQLLSGFYNIEENAWRWTMGKFAVALRPPRNASVRGATLHLKFVIPPAVIEKVKTTS